ncbi:hypothetical protein BDR07DRAFT_1522634 [Suillus spraguei]|nr:hypothetical protein BDR07DRAFT_1522634 [Suillus spraguei]
MDPRLVDQSYHISLCKEIFQNSQEDYEPDGVIFGPPALPTEVPKRLSQFIVSRLSTTADNHTGTRWTIGIGGGIRPDEEDEVSVYLAVGTGDTSLSASANRNFYMAAGYMIFNRPLPSLPADFRALRRSPICISIGPDLIFETVVKASFNDPCLYENLLGTGNPQINTQVETFSSAFLYYRTDRKELYPGSIPGDDHQIKGAEIFADLRPMDSIPAQSHFASHMTTRRIPPTGRTSCYCVANGARNMRSRKV